MFYIYILKSSKNNKYYVGCTNNVLRRVKEHNQGLSKYTKIGKPWESMYVEEYQFLSKARIREKQIKGWKKRSAIEKLLQLPSSSGLGQ